MNKKQIMAACLFFLSAYCACAEPVNKTILPPFTEFDAIYINEGVINGHHWKPFGQKEKRTYLLGYQDGVMCTAIYYVPDETNKTEAMDSFPSMDMDDLIRGVDEFYSDDRNLNIPVPYVLLVIRNRMIGADEKDINAYIEHLRDSSSKERGER